MTSQIIDSYHRSRSAMTPARGTIEGLRSTQDDVTWVTKRLDINNPQTLSHHMPVTRYKLLTSPQFINWRPQPDAKWYSQPPKFEGWTTDSGSRTERHFTTQPNTRCEEWSTLRQMLPSRGRAVRLTTPEWGIAPERPPAMTDEPQRTFPKINSCMTR